MPTPRSAANRRRRGVAMPSLVRHIGLFATDAPFDPEQGRALIADTLQGVAALRLPEAEMKLIFGGNAQALLKL